MYLVDWNFSQRLDRLRDKLERRVELCAGIYSLFSILIAVEEIAACRKIAASNAATVSKRYFNHHHKHFYGCTNTLFNFAPRHAQPKTQAGKKKKTNVSRKPIDRKCLINLIPDPSLTKYCAKPDFQNDGSNVFSTRKYAFV